VVKETPMKKRTTPSSVEGEDWVVLKLRVTPTQKKIKNKFSLSKVNVGEAFLGQSVGHVKYTFWCGVSNLSINFTNLKMPYGMYINEYNLIGISCNHKWLKKNYEGE
jgi:hypothetical protein